MQQENILYEGGADWGQENTSVIHPMPDLAVQQFDNLVTQIAVQDTLGPERATEEALMYIDAAQVKLDTAFPEATNTIEDSMEYVTQIYKDNDITPTSPNMDVNEKVEQEAAVNNIRFSQKTLRDELFGMRPPELKVPRATTHLITDEGYSERLPANVPADKSGITIGGLDLANGGDDTLKALQGILPDNTLAQLDAVKHLKGKAAKEALKNIPIKLSNAQIEKAQQFYLDRNVIPVMKKRVGADAFTKMPPSIKEPLIALSFLNKGKTSAKALGEYINNPTKANYSKAYKEFDKYWASQANSEHNRARSHRVRDAITEHYKNKS